MVKHMTAIYIDKVFLLNLILDYLLLLTTARLAGMPLQRLRLLLVSTVGAAYSVAIFVPPLTILAHPVFRLAVGVAMPLAAYRKLRSRWHMTGLFLLISAALGGVVLAIGLALGSANAVAKSLYYIHISWPLILGVAYGLYWVLHLLFRQGARHGGDALMKIRIGIKGRELEVIALHDTGNTLRDPVSGQPVLVIEQTALEGIWDETTARILSRQATAVEKISALHSEGAGAGFTLLPFRSVGTTAGLLLAVCSDWIRIGRARYKGVWIALSVGPLSDGGGYCALWGGVKRGEEYGELDRASVLLDTKTLQAG